MCTLGMLMLKKFLCFALIESRYCQRSGVSFMKKFEEALRKETHEILSRKEHNLHRALSRWRHTCHTPNLYNMCTVFYIVALSTWRIINRIIFLFLVETCVHTFIKAFFKFVLNHFLFWSNDSMFLTINCKRFCKRRLCRRLLSFVEEALCCVVHERMRMFAIS